jgi:hypothetical protein
MRSKQTSPGRENPQLKPLRSMGPMQDMTQNSRIYQHQLLPQARQMKTALHLLLTPTTTLHDQDVTDQVTHNSRKAHHHGPEAAALDVRITHVLPNQIQLSALCLRIFLTCSNHSI